MESTLSLQYNDLVGDVGLFLGYGRGAAFDDPAWTKPQQNVIDSIVKSGLRQFYFPPPLEGSDSSYDWSFMRPVGTADLPSGATIVPLPDDFGGFEGQITVVAKKSTSMWPIDLVNENRIRQMFSTQPDVKGRPIMAALVPLKATTSTAGQRQNMIFFPLADQEYTIQFAYYILPDYLNQAFPYAYGGMAHAETIREACLKAAEEFLDDASGVHAALFQQRLAASISMDRRNKPQKLGYNRDASDYPDITRRDLHYQNLVTIYGVQY